MLNLLILKNSLDSILKQSSKYFINWDEVVKKTFSINLLL